MDFEIKALKEAPLFGLFFCTLVSGAFFLIYALVNRVCKKSTETENFLEEVATKVNGGGDEDSSIAGSSPTRPRKSKRIADANTAHTHGFAFTAQQAPQGTSN